MEGGAEQCPVCHDPRTAVMLLQCGHPLCSACVERTADGGTELQCPTCRAACEVARARPHPGILALQRAHRCPGCHGPWDAGEHRPHTVLPCRHQVCGRCLSNRCEVCGAGVASSLEDGAMLATLRRIRAGDNDESPGLPACQALTAERATLEGVCRALGGWLRGSDGRRLYIAPDDWMRLPAMRRSAATLQRRALSIGQRMRCASSSAELLDLAVGLGLPAPIEALVHRELVRGRRIAEARSRGSEVLEWLGVRDLMLSPERNFAAGD